MNITRLFQFFSLIIIISIFSSACSSGESLIETSVGEMRITRTEILDEIGGSRANPGYKILLIFFENKEGETKEGFYEASYNVFLTSSSGLHQEPPFFGGIYHGENVLGFTIIESEKDFHLNWPGNGPIAIEIQRQ